MESFSSLDLEERQRLLGKLTKLKALAECKTGNVNETAAAAAAMTRLMMEYRIEMAELDASPPAAVVEEEATGECRGRGFPAWQNQLLHGLAEANGCVGFESRQTNWCQFSGSRLSVSLRLIGRAEDIGQTRTLYFFCRLAIERLCIDWWPAAPVARKNDFRQGAAVAITQKVAHERACVRREEQARAQSRGHESRALAVLDRRLDEVHEAAAQKGVRVVSRGGRSVSADAYAAGYRAGTKLSLPGQPALR